MFLCGHRVKRAVLIRGPKACGKTESARQLAGSILLVDRDPQVEALMHTAPHRLLLGETPRLMDEWQIQPRIWDYVRHEVDEQKKCAIHAADRHPLSELGISNRQPVN